jgi:hypothetical protein
MVCWVEKGYLRPLDCPEETLRSLKGEWNLPIAPEGDYERILAISSESEGKLLTQHRDKTHLNPTQVLPLHPSNKWGSLGVGADPKLGARDQLLPRL